MCPNSIFSRLTTAALAVALVALLARPAAAEDLRLGRSSVFAPSPAASQGPSLSTFANSALTIGYLSPAYGAMALGIPSGPLSPRALNGMNGGLGLLRAFELGGKYTTPVSIGRIGIYGSYSERPSILALTPSTTWSLGGTVGYGGFYLRAGVNEVAAVGPLLGLQGMQAGFGYELGGLDLRVTYLTSQGVGGVEREIDSKQWSIGGIYNITSRIRLNADAFYGVGENRGSALSVQPPLTSPPGTGARVGVQLRF
jgi:hypothetical protein